MRATPPCLVGLGTRRSSGPSEGVVIDAPPFCLFHLPAASLVPLLLVHALVGVQCRGGAIPGANSTNEDFSPTGLVIAPKHLRFDETWENPRFEWILPIENRRGRESRVARRNAAISS